jgi:hypothetical protein
MRKHGGPYFPQNANHAKQEKRLSNGAVASASSNLRDIRMRQVGRNSDGAISFEVAAYVINKEQ